MAQINIEKLIYDFICFEYTIKPDDIFNNLTNREKFVIQCAGTLVVKALENALEKQGFEYKDGEITEIKDK